MLLPRKDVKFIYVHHWGGNWTWTISLLSPLGRIQNVPELWSALIYIYKYLKCKILYSEFCLIKTNSSPINPMFMNSACNLDCFWVNSVFSQAVQSQPAPAQPGVYNNMSITVSMAGGNANVQNMNPMMGQMQMSSLQMPGMNTVCSEQVSSRVGSFTTHHTTLSTTEENQVCWQLSAGTMLLYPFPLSD